MRAALVLAIVATACSVPDVSLDGKQCPCTNGYVCDTSTNTCRTMLGDGSGSGGPTCLGPEPSGPLYSDTFDSGTLDWAHTAGFTETGGQLVQSDTLDPAAFATPNATGAVATATTYRIVAEMTGTSTGTGMGLAFRVQAGQKSQYDCLWEPGATAGALLLRRLNNGGQATTIGSKSGLPNPGATTKYTMEVLAQDSTFTCCLDNITTATLTASDTTMPTGLPGVATAAMAASFDNFAVYSN